MYIRAFILGLLAFAASVVQFASAEPVQIGGTGAALDVMRQLSQAYAERKPGFTVRIPPSLGSAGAIRAVRAGAIDLGVTGRPLAPAEKDPALRQLAFATTPWMFVTSHSTASSLTVADIHALYGRSQTRWADGSPVRLILRPPFDSDSELLIALFPALGPVVQRVRTAPDIIVAPTDQDNAEAALRLEGSLTTITLLQLTTERLALRPLTVNGTAPRVDSAPNPAYPFTKTMYLIVRAPTADAVRDFLTFIEGPEAGALLRNNGATPIMPLREP